MKKLSEELLVIGLDPGLTATGYAILKMDVKGPALLKAGTLRPKKEWDLWKKLFYIYNELFYLLKNFMPKEAAIEDVFVSKNAKSALKLGHARGVVMIACVQYNIKIFQYEPSVVKKSITGTGRASKNQIKYMASKILGIEDNFSYDAGDAIAVGICHLNQRAFYDRIS